MYIDPFWAGVGVTVLVEIVLLIVAAVVTAGRKR